MSRPRVLVRADASAAIGTGHVTRCLALADELATRGWDVRFASRKLPAALDAELRRRAGCLIEIPAAVAIEQEPAYLVSRPETQSLAATIVDHYGIHADWHRAARPWSGALVAIDDLAITALDVDLIVNQNLGESPNSYVGLVPESCLRLVGPRYALLRRQFRAARGSAPRVRTHVERVLVFLSGADGGDATSIAAQAMARTGIPTDVVVGPAYPHFDPLAEWSATQPTISLHRDVADMATLMDRADLSIGAPSSASWERCCLGLPTILVTLADNQVRAGAAIAAAGAGVALGWYSEVTAETLAAGILDIAESPKRLAAMSRAAANVTDGRGAERVAEGLERLVAPQV